MHGIWLLPNFGQYSLRKVKILRLDKHLLQMISRSDLTLLEIYLLLGEPLSITRHVLGFTNRLQV